LLKLVSAETGEVHPFVFFSAFSFLQDAKDAKHNKEAKHSCLREDFSTLPPRSCRTAQHRLYAPLDTYPAEKLNKPAYLVDSQGIAKNRRHRVPYSTARKQARCPSGSRLKEAAHAW
jgi:hypothetical protein